MASNRIRRNKNRRRVILDSNALMMLFEFSIDLEDELQRLLGKYEIIIPEPIIEELKNLSKFGEGKQSRIAKPALKLSKKYRKVKLDKEKKGDDAVLYLAKKLQTFVLTNDKELKEKLKDESLPVIYLRGKQKLAVDY